MFQIATGFEVEVAFCPLSAVGANGDIAHHCNLRHSVAHGERVFNLIFFLKSVRKGCFRTKRPIVIIVPALPVMDIAAARAQ